MTVAAALLAGAALVAWLAPGVLWRLHRGRLHPLPLIVAWFAAIAGVLATMTVAAVLLLVPDHGVADGPLRLLSRCWTHVAHGASPPVEQAAGSTGLLLVAALIVRLAVVTRRQARRARRARSERVAVLRLAARTEPTSPPTLWLAHDRPLAFSLSGRPGYVVATEGLTRYLGRPAVAAVLEHERAHLRGRHHLIVAAADAASAALPWAPLLREAPAALRELVELAADVSAVRAYGNAALRTALLGVVAGPAAGAALGIGHAAIAARLARLDRQIAPARPSRRGLASALLGVAALLPVIVAAALLITGLLLFCPTG